MSEETESVVAGLRGTELIAALERADAQGTELGGLDVNELVSTIDPRALGKDDFRRLLSVLVRAGERAPQLDLSEVQPQHFATLVARASKAQLDAVVAERALRARLLDEVFDRMRTHLRRDRARNVHAVVHWRISGGTGEGGYDRYETEILDGDCRVGRAMREKPRVTITVGSAEFFKLITHQTTPAVLFVTGKIKVKGDLAFAAGLIGFFDLPSPA
jgi:putative sterol carrier protein